MADDTQIQDRLAPTRLLDHLLKTAENQKAHFEARQFALPSIEDYIDKEGHLDLPADIGPLLEQCAINGRYSEADWWIGTISSLVRRLAAEGDMAAAGSEASLDTAARACSIDATGTGTKEPDPDPIAAIAADRDKYRQWFARKSASNARALALLAAVNLRVERLESRARARETLMEDALKAVRRASALDGLVSGARAAVMARFAEIHQHADAALALAVGPQTMEDRRWPTAELPGNSSDGRVVASGAEPGAVPGIGPVPAYECEFRVGQAVRIGNSRDGEDPEAIWFVTGIQWRHQKDRADHGWDITLASAEDIARGYGATDGYRPEDLVPAFLVPRHADIGKAALHTVDETTDDGVMEVTP